MILVLMILTCSLFAIPDFSYDEAATEEFFLSTPEQVVTPSGKPMNCPESRIPKVSQGTLSNGMRFYSCPFYKFPENEVTFSIVLKKIDQANSLPSFDFFEEAVGYKKAFAQSTYIVTPELYSFTLSIRGNYPLSITSILNAFAEYLENLNMSVNCIKEIRKEYAEDLGEKDSEGKGSIHLHMLSDDQIKDLYRELFNPSQMAIVITGGFDSADLVVDLENSLGKIAGNEFSCIPFYKKAPHTIAIREELPEDIIDQASSAENRVGYEYIYFVSPTFKSHDLKDIFRLIGLEQGIILPPGSFYYARFPQDPYRFANLYPRESVFLKKKSQILNATSMSLSFQKRIYSLFIVRFPCLMI